MPGGTEGEKPRFLSASVSLTGLVVAAGLAASVATVLGFLGGLAWFFDLFSHFRVQYFLGLLTIAVVIAILRRWRTAACFTIMSLVNLAVILPCYFGGADDTQPGAPTIRAMLINVNTHAGNPEAVGAAIKRYDPDVLVLEEISPRWVTSLKNQLDAYRCSRAVTRDDNFGIGLYSKFSITNVEAECIGQPEVPSIIAEVDSRVGRFMIIATHPVPPSGRIGAMWRDSQLAELPRYVRKTSLPVVLLGDLNATPWSVHFRRLLAASGLRDSSKGRGVHPTWPAFNPLLRIPLDHCLHSPDAVIVNRMVGTDAGSDHYPLIVDFFLRSKPL